MQLSDTSQYQRILDDLTWLDRNVICGVEDFAAQELEEVARKVARLVELVDDLRL